MKYLACFTAVLLLFTGGCKKNISDSQWEVVAGPCAPNGKDVIPIANLDAYFSYDDSGKATVNGILGFGSYDQKTSITINLKILFHHIQKTITVANEWLGGMVSNFTYANTAWTDTWQHDYQTDPDNGAKVPDIRILKTKQYGDGAIDWVAVTGDRKILYFNPEVKLIDLDDIHVINIDDQYGDVEFIDVLFPDSRLFKDIQMVVFFNNGGIYRCQWDEAGKAQQLVQVSTPVAITSFSNISVNWNHQDSNGAPEMLVAATSADTLYYYDYANENWNSLSPSALRLFRVSWADDAVDSQIAGITSSGASYCCKGITLNAGSATTDCTEVGGSHSSEPLQFAAQFSSMGSDPYPQMITWLADGEIAYFNGGSGKAWKVLREKDSSFKADAQLTGLTVQTWPASSTATPAYPDFAAWYSNPSTTYGYIYHFNNQGQSSTLLDTDHGGYITTAAFGWNNNDELSNVLIGMQDGIHSGTVQMLSLGNGSGAAELPLLPK